MEFTGTGIEGPGADLRFAQVDGAEHVAIVYHEPYRDHPALDSGLDDFRQFLTRPGIDGVLSLVDVPEPGVFLYDLRGGLTVAEILAAFRERGEPAGDKAALELIVQGAEVLADASDLGADVGLPNHGDVSPWRLVVDDEGYLDVMGHGLLNLAVVEFLDERADTVPADGLRYAPPERLELQAEDIHADLYSLILIGVEVMTGEPVLPGTAEDVIEATLAGEVPGRIEKLCDGASDAVLDLLCIGTELDVAERYADVDEFIRAAKAALDTVDGPSLLDVLDTARQVDVRVPLDGDDPDSDQAIDEPPADEPEPEDDAPVDEVPAEQPERPAEPEPEPEPEEDEEDDDPFAPPRALTPLDDSASLEDVQGRAGAIVERVQAIAKLAATIVETGEREAGEANGDAASLIRRMKDAVSKADKAHKSAERSAGLVELDDEASEALVTLGFITAAEQQAENALSSARDWLGELRGVLREARAERDRIVRLQDEIQGLSDRAHASGGGGESSLEAATQAASAGELSAAGVDEALERARAALERARSAMAKVDESVDEVAGCSAAVDAEAYAETARTALTSVQAAVGEVEDAVEAARAAEQAGLQSARSEIEAASRTATSSHDSAARAVERARSAVEQGPSPEATQLLAEAEEVLGTAKRAASDAALEARSVAEASSSAEARTSLEPARQAAEQAEQAAERIDSIVDRIVSLAGAAAEAAAALMGARKTADKLLDKSKEQVLKARDVVRDLVKDTEEVQGSQARDLVEQATEALDEADSALEDLEGKHALVARMDDAAEVEQVVSSMRPLATTCTRASAKALDADERCRQVAQDEIAELLKERRRIEKLDKAASAAREHADRALQAVADAWERYRGLGPRVKDTDITQARELLQQAYDAIDIAQFQAQEADNAAKDAKRQADPAEARAYADTAASFWERVREDLPEALRSIDEAEEMVMRLVRMLEEARQRTSAAALKAAGDRDALANLESKAEQLAQEWPSDKAVQGALKRVRKANSDLDGDLAITQEARDQAHEDDNAEAAQSVVPKGESAANRIGDKRAAAEAALDDLKKAVQAARQEAEQVASLQSEVDGLVQKSGALRKAVLAGHERLDRAVASHGASGDAVVQVQQQVEQRVKTAEDSTATLSDAQSRIHQTTVADAATGQAERARAAFASLESAGEGLDELVEQGVQAAQEEAQARAEAEEKRKAEARDAASASASKARDAVAAVRHQMDLVKETVDRAPAGPAKEQLAEAQRLLKKLEKLAKESDKAASRAASADDTNAVLSAGMDAREASQRSASASKQALEALREAQDLAEAEIAQALALDGIKKEMQDLAERADAAVKLAREQSSFLDEVLDEARTEQTRALRKEADDAISNARKAATKVHTAQPMVAEAESLDVAKHMLRAAQKAVTRAIEAADEVPRLVERAKERLVEEAEELQRQLDEAREQAQAPLEPTRAAAEKARAWLDSGQTALAEHAGEPGIAEAFASLSEALNQVETKLTAAEEAADPVRSVPTKEEAEALGQKVQAACDAVMEATKAAKTHHGTLEEAVNQAVARAEELARTKAEAKEGAQEASERLEGLRKDFAAFEKEVEETDFDESETADLVDRVEEFLRSGSEAVHGATTAADAVDGAEDPEAVAKAGALAKERAERAQEALEELVKGLADGRDELTRMVEEAAERRRQEAEAARLRELEEKRERERAERRAARPAGRGLRPAGPPRGSASRGARPDRTGGSSRLRRPSRTGRGRGASDDDGDEAESRADRRLRRPSRRASESGQEDASASRADRRLRRPSRSRSRSRSDGDADSSKADRRLRRPSRSRSRDGDGDGDSPAERRLRRPSRSRSRSGDGDEGDSPSDRRLRRPSRSRTRSRGGDDSGDSPSDRRLRRPSRGRGSDDGDDTSGEQDQAPSRDDLRSRLRERRASQMAGNRSGRGAGRGAGGSASERPQRPGRSPRPGRGGPRGRLPARPGGVKGPEGGDPPGSSRGRGPGSSSDDGGEGGGESGADLLRRRLKERGSRPAPRESDDRPARSGRSVDDLMARLKRSKNRNDD